MPEKVWGLSLENAMATLTMEQFYTIWDIEDLRYASKVAANNRIPIFTTLKWVRTRYLGYGKK
jgi:hypothetical protein